ncbi:UNVERIFIED_CONTAM: hypothetical protein RMT77_013809 [Armadillidium vulgare]
MFKIFFALFALVTTASAVIITNCNSTGIVDMDNIKVTGCTPQRRYCLFKKGEDAELELPFTPRNPVQKMTAYVTGIISHIPIPFPIPNSNACLNSDLTCPLSPDTEVTYKAKLAVKKGYPAVHVKVRWELRDEHGGDVVCIEIPVQIV